MSPQRLDEYMQLRALALSLVDDEQAPQFYRDWEARILKLAPIELPFIPPVSQFAEPVHLADE